MKTRFFPHFLGAAGVSLLGAASLHAQTATYSDNFDSDTAGALPANWQTLIGNAFSVQASANSVTSPNSLGQASPADGSVCVYEGGAAFGNGWVLWSQTVSTGAGGTHGNICAVLSCNAAGSQFYMANPNFAGNTLGIYRYVNGYTQIGTYTIPAFANGTHVYIRFTRNGGAFAVNVWQVGTTEPTTPTISTGTIDSTPLGVGYPGLRTGVVSGTPVTGDDFAYYAAPVTATGYQVTAPGTMVQGVAQACTLATSPAGGTLSSADTVTYSDNLSTHGVFSPATQAYAAGSAASYSFSYTPPAAYTGNVTLTATSANGLTAGTATATVIQPPVVYAAGSALIHYSPYQWHPSTVAGEMETNCSGSSLTLNVAGTTSFTVNFDVGSPVVAGALLRVRVDSNAVTNTTVPTGGAYTVTLPNGNAHTVYVQFPFLAQTPDRWVTPASVVRLVNVTLPAGAALAAVTGLPAGKLLVYGDSRGEAAQLSDVFAAFPYFFSQTLGLELGDRSFASMGWQTTNVTTASQDGDIVPEFTVGNDAQSAWDKYDATHPLLVGGLYAPAPAAILDLLGLNSALKGESDASVTASVTGLLTAQRAAAGPACLIFLAYDFSGYERNPLLAGYTAYEQATSDPRCFLIDPGTVAGLTNGGASYLAGDGIHPNALGHAVVGALLSGAAQNALKVRAGLGGFFF